MGGQVRIVSGVPLGVVDAVDDAGQLAGALQQYALQAKAEVQRLNLACIHRADRVEQIGKHQAGLEKVEKAVKFQEFVSEKMPGKAKIRQVGRIEQALIGEIVNGAQDAKLLKALP